MTLFLIGFLCGAAAVLFTLVCLAAYYARHNPDELAVR